jgi:dTDP-4-dehydrorhamnose 3,5-epimerase
MMKCGEDQIDIIKECYFSEIAPGSIKAWKLHKNQTQNIAVPIGCIKIVIYDDRENSKSKGKTWVENLGRPNNYWRIKIPPKLWYGFYCNGISSALIINCTDRIHDPMESERLPLDNKIIPHGEDFFSR